MGRVLASDNTATASATVPIIGTAGVTIADIYSVVVPPSRDYSNVKVTAVVEILTAVGATAQAVNFDIRANGIANNVAATHTYAFTTRAAVDRVLNTYTAVIPNINHGGTLKLQFSAAAADANAAVVGKSLVVEAV